ncbi:MAG: hypothetical protein DMD98_17060 [Candidatus Rokuibacteriota bacterium]|nr:MAG: hypothetical protein DMD98_17060 [Candidatus Rokubacteria bacterium]
MKSLAGLIGESPGIASVRETIDRLLLRQVDGRRLPPILIQGETGTGKGLLARALHAAGPRSDGPFVDVNCAAIPETLLEAELFGFERGAFTDARQAKCGLFQAAHRGTIFLDEIALLPSALQGKLLAVLEDRAVRRLGSTRSESVDTWILTASNENLVVGTRQGRFREDLYHRLAVITVGLPPLRERGDDIILLAQHFLSGACADYKLPPRALSPGAAAALLAYHWPGNVRELANVIERVALLSEARLVTEEILGLSGSRSPSARARTQIPGEDALQKAHRERDELLEALQQADWNISRAAAQLGLPRNTIRYRIDKYGLSRDAVRPGAQSEAAQQPAEPAPAPAPTGPPSYGVRWQQRHLALLRAVVVREPDGPGSSRTVEPILEKLGSFGGTVVELSPTGLVAAFGLEGGEDAATEASHAALALLRLAEIARRGGRDAFPLRVGIHVGQFLVGQVNGAVQIDFESKRMAWAVLDALTDAAPPGAVLVSEGAAPFLERRFRLSLVGPLERLPEQTYRLAGLERTGLGIAGRMPPFLGRHHEFELLRSRLAAAAEGRGQVVEITGEAGIGKSRLLFELRQTLGEVRATYLEGRCRLFARAMPYVPLRDIVRSLCQIAEFDAPASIVERVRLRLRDAGIDQEQPIACVLRLLGLSEGTEALESLSPEAIKARTFETLRRICLNLGRQQPLVLAIENLQWIDRTSDEFLASLVDALARAPVLLALIYRPGYRPAWSDKSYATQVALQPLGEEDGRAIVRWFLGTAELPEAPARAIVSRAEGNPFFLEELSRAVIEQGHVGATMTVPATIQEALLARIGRLGEEPRRLLQATAVLGREVPLRLLQAIPETATLVEPHVRELVRLEILYEQVGGVEPGYVFAHALIREVAYASVPPEEKQALHMAAARALETLYAAGLERVWDRLAHHYSRTQDATKALEYLGRVAERSAGSHAHAETVVVLQEALAQVERLPAEERDRRRVDLVLREVHSLSFLGRFGEALELLLGERDRVDRLQAPDVAGRYHFWLGHSYSYLGDQERATADARRALEEATRSGDEATMGKAHLLLAQESSWSGQPAEGIEHGRRAVELLERAGERWWLSLAHWMVGINHIITGEFRPAVEAEARARAVGEGLGDPRLQSYAAWTIGWIHALKGEWEPAIQECQRGLDLSPDPVNTAVALGHLGYAYLVKGDVAQAIALLEQSLSQVSRFGFRRLQGRFATFLGEAYLASGKLDRALELVSEGLRVTIEARYWYAAGWAQLVLGRAELAAGKPGEAEGQLAAALETFTSIRARFMVGQTHRVLAELGLARSDHDGARTHLQEAYGLFTALRLPVHQERARQLAKTLGVVLSD